MNRYYKIALILLLLIVACFCMFYVVNKSWRQRVFVTKQVSAKREAVPIKGRVAIVLDDWGYNSRDLPLLYKIKHPVTVSILPNLRYSEKVARDAKSNGYQTILHLPLESKYTEIPEKDTLYCAMSQGEITRGLKLSLNSVPGVLGVNNHQGSKATEDARIMKIILSELKNDKMFFLDSLTTNKSVCSTIAKEIGLKHAKRDVFLDEPDSKLEDKEQVLYIQKQLYKLADLAVKKGYAVGIGHDRKITLNVLKDMMLRLEKKGIKFVFVSELTK